MGGGSEEIESGGKWLLNLRLKRYENEARTRRTTLTHTNSINMKIKKGSGAEDCEGGFGPFFREGSGWWGLKTSGDGS